MLILLVKNTQVVLNKLYDKGFSAKIKLLRENGAVPQIAIGLNDFAGTGFYNSEYLVVSKRIGRFDLSAGLGWGNYRME